uniref:hypothetical protein n=1 Tax=Vibrio anguillarum TaxID=55601 RepID=UPI001BE4C41A
MNRINWIITRAIIPNNDVLNITCLSSSISLWLLFIAIDKYLLIDEQMDCVTKDIYSTISIERGIKPYAITPNLFTKYGISKIPIVTLQANEIIFIET